MQPAAWKAAARVCHDCSAFRVLPAPTCGSACAILVQDVLQPSSHEISSRAAAASSPAPTRGSAARPPPLQPEHRASRARRSRQPGRAGLWPQTPAASPAAWPAEQGALLQFTVQWFASVWAHRQGPGRSSKLTASRSAAGRQVASLAPRQQRPPAHQFVLHGADCYVVLAQGVPASRRLHGWQRAWS